MFYNHINFQNYRDNKCVNIKILVLHKNIKLYENINIYIYVMLIFLIFI